MIRYFTGKTYDMMVLTSCTRLRYLATVL